MLSAMYRLIAVELLIHVAARLIDILLPDVPPVITQVMTIIIIITDNDLSTMMMNEKHFNASCDLSYSTLNVVYSNYHSYYSGP